MFVFKLALFLTGTTWSTGSLLFTKRPRNIYFANGSDAVFEWDYSDTTGELDRIIWTVYNKIDAQLKPILIVNRTGDEQPNQFLSPAYTGRVEMKGRASLVIKNITFEDSTDFTCSLQTKNAVADSDTATLFVTGPSFIRPFVEFPEVGGSSTFTCNATGVPSQNFTWMRQGDTKKIKSDLSHTITCSGTGSCELTIKNITVGNLGHYICDATVNPKQPNSAKGYLQVKYLKQDDTSCPEMVYSVASGDQQELCCPVRGYPPPVVTWKKNGTQLLKNENAVLTITPVKDEDFENYTCTATDGKTSIGPFVVSVMKKIVDLPVGSTNGTNAEAAKMEWEPQIGAKFYVVKISGEDILDDVLVGTQTSLEFHYNALVMKKAGERPKDTTICANVTAMNDAGVIRKTPTCQYITIRSHQVTLKSNIACFLLVLTGNLVW